MAGPAPGLIVWELIAHPNELSVKKSARKTRANHKQTKQQQQTLRVLRPEQKNGAFCDPQWLWAVLLPLYLCSLFQVVLENFFPFTGCCHSPSTFKIAHLYLLVAFSSQARQRHWLLLSWEYLPFSVCFTGIKWTIQVAPKIMGSL